MSKELRFAKPLASLSKLICLTDALVSGPRVEKTSYDKHKAMVAQFKDISAPSITIFQAIWCRTWNQLIASEFAIIDTAIFEMDCVSTSLGTHDTTYYPDTFAD